MQYIMLILIILYINLHVFDFVNKRWNKLIIAPSNYVPASVDNVIGENDFHNIFSLTLVAINKDIPEPNPKKLIKYIYITISFL